MKKIQDQVKAHLRALNRIFSTGKNHGERSAERACKAKEAKATVIPNLYIFPKDHKDIQEDGNPKTCPVCGASSTINQELSEWISELPESALKGMNQADVISTEEMLSCIDELNEAWKENQFNPGWDEIFV